MPIEGVVDQIGARQVSGWVFQPEDPDAHPLVTVRLADRLIGEVIANDYRADLADAGIGKGDHGYVVMLDAALQPRQFAEVIVEATTADGGREIIPAGPDAITAADAGVWQENLGEEAAFWDGVLGDPATERTPPIANLAWLRPLLSPQPGPQETLRALDVGSGPISTLGVAGPGGQLEIVPVDALGETYNALLDRHGLGHFPRILPIKGEDLSKELGAESFHLVHCANALDHFEDPAAAFGEMIKLCKPGGVVVLISIENEGERESYEGLHQWNLRADDQGIWLWNKSMETNLLEPFRSVVDYSWERPDSDGAEWTVFSATLRKAAA